MNKSNYEKCIELIVKLNEAIVEGESEKVTDPLEEKLGSLRKRLSETESEVIGRLIRSLFVQIKKIDIDESTGGSLDND